MKERGSEELVQLAKGYCENGTPWHHHFLTLKCMFNKGDKFSQKFGRIGKANFREKFACIGTSKASSNRIRKFQSNKRFQIILENEETGESFVSQFDYRPMKELELLENLFFKRKK
jgi:hypothetical protein